MFKMSAKAKKITAIVIAALMVFAFIAPLFFPALAQADTALYASRQQNMNKIQGEIKEQKDLQKDVVAQKEAADKKVMEVEGRIAVLEGEIKTHTQKLAELELELTVATEDARRQYETLKLRMRAMYEEGTDSYLTVLLSSESITDFLYRFEIIRQITEYDSNKLNSLRDAMARIEDATVQAEIERNALVDKNAAFRKEKNVLLEEQKKRDAILDESKATVAELEKRYRQEEELMRKEREAAAARMKANTRFVGGAMEWPTPGYYKITDPYGMRYHPVLKRNRMHAGMDIGAPSGATVVAANAGTVITSALSSSYGNYIIIDHGGGVATLYAHGTKRLVSVGAEVTRGQEIMTVGSTGISTGPHLHFEVIVGGKTVDPASYY